MNKSLKIFNLIFSGAIWVREMEFEKVAADNGFDSIHNEEFAKYLDSLDELAHLRNQFNIPQRTRHHHSPLNPPY